MTVLVARLPRSAPITFAAKAQSKAESSAQSLETIVG